MLLLQVLYYIGPIFPPAVVLLWEDEVGAFFGSCQSLDCFLLVLVEREIEVRVFQI